MRCLVINLYWSWERQEAVQGEFRKVGLNYELWPAVDGSRLTEEHHQAIDHDTRRRLGLRPLDAPSIACLLSHLSVFRELVQSGEDMLAVFEDDARLHTDLPTVLDALEGKANKFGIIRLQRRNGSAPYYPVYQIQPPYSLGRVKYHDRGADGYVITRHAAEHLLERFPRMYWEIDWLIPRFWDTGLDKVLYLNPPIVFHDGILPSYIEPKRLPERIAHRRRVRRNVNIAARRFYAGVRNSIRRWFRFKMLRWRDLRIDSLWF